MKLLIFAASHRPESFNRKLAQIAAKHMTAQKVQVDFAEYREFDMPIYNDDIDMPDHCHAFGKRAASADGIIISSPEYNWSYPGSLKSVIDWTSCILPNPLKGKTALLLSASPGIRGGLLGLNHLKTPLEALQVFVFPKAFPLGNSKEAFNGNGDLADAAQHRNLAALLNDYIAFTNNLSHHG